MRERIGTYACYAVGDCDACEAGATPERIISYACYAVGDNSIFATGDKSVARGFYDCIAIIAAIIFCISACNNNACDAGATIERVFSYAFYAVGDCDACEAGAICERIISYAFYAVGDCDAC